MTDLGAQRVAMNNNAFRAANERIQGFVRNLDAPAQIPFICECAAEGCTQIVMLTLDEYEGVRTDPAHFLCVPGHEEADEPWGKVVDNRPASVIVEKVGEAARSRRNSASGLPSPKTQLVMESPARATQDGPPNGAQLSARRQARPDRLVV